MLEALDHAGRSSFVTLTYAEENVPRGFKDQPNLEARDLQLWLKRFRKKYPAKFVRFFAVGEYGDVTARPHFHAALFGPASCPGGPRAVSGFSVNSKPVTVCLCRTCSDVRETWDGGHSLVSPMTPGRARYLSGYVVKRMTHRLDPRLDGRNPEFSRMSLNPGIGAGAMKRAALAVNPSWVDVPGALRHGAYLQPLGKYLRKKLRKEAGRDENAPRSTLQEAANKMQLLRAFAWQNDRSVSSVFRELNEPYEAVLTARDKIRGKTL